VDNGNRYVGLDVHRDTISVAVLDSRGKQILDKVIPTSAAALRYKGGINWQPPASG
jgi:predicted NBD/HSP70 family sugar kinase